ncbi:OsmC family protein [[Eubacterium] cellulosolvens]
MEMSTEKKVFTTKLSRISNYQFKANFDSPKDFEVLIDEPEPIGQGSAPNASRFLAAAVGNCLSASLLFCLGKAKIDLREFNTVVETVMHRNEKGRWRIASIKVKLKPQIEKSDIVKSKRCLDLFEDFCIVTQSVRKGINVDVDIDLAESY